MTIEEKRRELFEAWFIETYSAHKIGRRMTMGGDLSNEYADPRTDMCWMAWNAAMDASRPFSPDWAGYRKGVSDGRADTVDQLKAENEALRSVANELRRFATCEDVHHDKPDWHEYGEPCKVLARIDAAMSQGDKSGD